MINPTDQDNIVLLSRKFGVGGGGGGGGNNQK